MVTERETAESDEGNEFTNGLSGSVAPSPSIAIERSSRETLFEVLRDFLSTVFSPETAVSPPSPFLKRVKASFSKTAPRLREASRNSACNLIIWTRSGSPLRALLVISVGTITLLALTGLLVFMLFFLVATSNAIIISFLISLGAAGGFLAIFFACLTAIYIGALSVAIFIISTTTISTVIAVIIATGWVGFFWVIWIASKKSINHTKQSLLMTSSAISAYYVARRAKRDMPSKSSN